jgi:hypothetical protein
MRINVPSRKQPSSPLAIILRMTPSEHSHSSARVATVNALDISFAPIEARRAATVKQGAVHESGISAKISHSPYPLYLRQHGA